MPLPACSSDSLNLDRLGLRQAGQREPGAWHDGGGASSALTHLTPAKRDLLGGLSLLLCSSCSTPAQQPAELFVCGCHFVKQAA